MKKEIKYRMLELGETKIEGDELRKHRPNGWGYVFNEIGTKVTEHDLGWGEYRRPVIKNPTHTQLKSPISKIKHITGKHISNALKIHEIETVLKTLKG